MLGNLSKGEIYTGTIDRISSSGNAIIETETSHINLGSGAENMVGRTVAFEYKGGTSGEKVPMNKVDRTDNPMHDSSSSNKNHLLGGHL